ISVDNNKTEWLKAIRKDRLPWPQVIDEGSSWQGKASRLYNVNALPAKYLVDANGVIISEKLTLEQLELALKKALSAEKK
ncbi:MAG TPA: hypothetical protein VEB42_16235, partial [Chitinophagaceae bacterium]|nr:hypothetical protein [Chitinophagaceae bacterium]